MYRPITRVMLSTFFVFLCCHKAALAQGHVRGIVVHELTGTGVSGVIVQFTPRRLRTTTGVDGRFFLEGVPTGTRELQVRRIGYRVGSAIVDVVEGDTVDVTIVISPAATRLRDIVVTPGRFGVLDANVVSNQTLSREDIETIPQVGEDVFRAIKRLPGLAAGDISTRLNVRGGTDQELLVLLDGMELYEPYHLKDFDGVLGIVDVYSVGGIDLATGGFGVEYGDHTAGLVSMRTRIPPTAQTRTTLGVSITNLSLMNQGAFSGGRGQWLVSARRGYLDVALKLTGGDDNLSPVYWDVLGKLEYQLSDRHRMTFNTLHAFDDLNFADFDEDGLLESRWNSNYGWSTWSADWSDNISMQAIAFVGRVNRERGGWFDENRRLRGPERAFVSDGRTLNVGGGRVDFGFSFSDRALLKVGVEAKHQRADYLYQAETRSVRGSSGSELVARFDTLTVDIEPRGEELATYAALRVQPVEGFTFEIGARYDRVTHTGDNDVGPRVFASYDLSGATTIRGSLGRYFQSHGIHQLDVGDGVQSFFPSDRADQMAVGVEHRIGGVTLRGEAYRRVYADQRPRFLSLDRELDPFAEVEWDRVGIDPDNGEARGAELFVQRDVGGAWAWSVAYALSEARDNIDGQWVPRTFDQRHALTLSVIHRPSDRWHISAAFHFHSGWPITESVFGADTLADGTVELTRDFSALNAERLPSYHRIDFRVTRNFPLGRGTLQAYFDMFNLYNRKNLRSYFYSVRFNDGQLTSRRGNGEEMLPFLPSLGLRWEF